MLHGMSSMGNTTAKKIRRVTSESSIGRHLNSGVSQQASEQSVWTMDSARHIQPTLPDSLDSTRSDF